MSLTKRDLTLEILAWDLSALANAAQALLDALVYDDDAPCGWLPSETERGSGFRRSCVTAWGCPCVGTPDQEDCPHA